MKNEKCCGNCIWHIHNGNEWICSCDDSEGYGLETEYTDTCNEFLDRDN